MTVIINREKLVIKHKKIRLLQAKAKLEVKGRVAITRDLRTREEFYLKIRK
jgi:hypothetical protein